MIPEAAVEAAYEHRGSIDFPVTCVLCWALVDYKNREGHLEWHEAQK